MNKYSFVLPVRNAGKYIRGCIESILAQTYPHFDLLVLENQSEDDTLSIINGFKDTRIKVFSAEKTLTIEENWGRAAIVAKNEYMTITGHDDVFDRDYLQVMDNLVRRHPLASLYQSHFRYIDLNGMVTGKCTPMSALQKPAKAVSNFVSGGMDVIGTGFLMRSKDFELAGGMTPYPNLLFADMEMWIELSRKSYLSVEPRELFSFRRHAASTTSGSSDARLLAAFEKMVRYLSELRKKQPCLAESIQSSGQNFLLQYGLGLTHNILRTPKKQRNTPDVPAVIEQFRQFGKLMGLPNFEPLACKRLRIGKIIDENLLFQRLYLLFHGFTFASLPVWKNKTFRLLQCWLQVFRPKQQKSRSGTNGSNGTFMAFFRRVN